MGWVCRGALSAGLGVKVLKIIALFRGSRTVIRVLFVIVKCRHEYS